jgi:hypothetical protein
MNSAASSTEQFEFVPLFKEVVCDRNGFLDT